MRTWLGRLIAHSFTYPGIRDPGLITFFDRSDPSSLTKMLPAFAARMKEDGRSMMVHVEGTRSLHCAEPVSQVSGAFLDLARSIDAPVVPVRFCGGLPRTPLESRLEFPVGMGQQDIWIGRPLLPEQLAALTYGERRQAVIDAINDLGPGHEHEQPLPGDAAFERAVAGWQAERGVSHGHATLRQILAECSYPCPGTETLLGARDAQSLEGDQTPEGRWLHQLARWLLG